MLVLRLALHVTGPAVAVIPAAASEAPSQASSYAGPLTSAMTTSKVLRTVRDHATRSEGTVPLGGGMAPGGSMRQGVRHSHDSTCSSQVSETGVVNSPMVSKQQSGALQEICIVCAEPARWTVGGLVSIVSHLHHAWRLHACCICSAALLHPC